MLFRENVRATAQALLAFVKGTLLMDKTYNDPEVIKKNLNQY